MKHLTTKAGMDRVHARLRQAQGEYERVVASNADAADAGDNCVWHDNFAYEENQRLMHQWGRRIHDLKNLLGRLEIVSVPEEPAQVQVGCRVLLEDTQTGEQRSYTIAGFEDGDPDAGRVSYTAPLGHLLMGAEEGDTRRLEIDGKRREWEVVSIERAPDL